MEVLILTIPLSILLALAFVGFFIWSVDSGQMEGLESRKNMIFDQGEERTDVSRTS